MLQPKIQRIIDHTLGLLTALDDDAAKSRAARSKGSLFRCPEFHYSKPEAGDLADALGFDDAFLTILSNMFLATAKRSITLVF